MCLSLQHETIPVQLPLTSIITPGMIVNYDMISAHFRMKCVLHETISLHLALTNMGANKC